MKDDKRLKRKVRNFYLVSTVSMALVLFLLGSVGYLMVAATKVARSLQESISVSVELHDGLSDEQKQKLNERIAAEELVGEIVYSSKEEKLTDSNFQKMFESEFEEILGENPLFDSFELKLTTQSENQEAVDAFIQKVEAMKGIDRVSYPAMMAERLHAT
ncbi:MAG: permease-like cell division protein FtsX, partial [Alistipes sp.]